MELFSELYSCYFTVLADILHKAHRTGVTKEEIDAIVAEKAFSESGLHLVPRLVSGEWGLLREEQGRYYSRLEHADTRLPLTLLQKSWLRALLSDRRIRLFLDKAQIQALKERLAGVEPLFVPGDFHIFDAATDGDDYGDETYIQTFRTMLEGIKGERTLLVEYQKGKGGRMSLYLQPTRLLYSAKDDKFRVAGLQLWGERPRHVLLNLSRITDVRDVGREMPGQVKWEEMPPTGEKRWVTLAVSGERNALERCMLQFASYDKQTVFDEETERHICKIFYEPTEEAELLIRVLSFGPVVRVLGPEPFLEQMRERLKRQLGLIHYTG